MAEFEYKYLSKKLQGEILQKLEIIKNKPWFSAEDVGVTFLYGVGSNYLFTIFPVDTLTRLKMGKIKDKQRKSFVEADLNFIKNTSSNFRPFYKFGFVNPKDWRFNESSEEDGENNTLETIKATRGTPNYLYDTSVCPENYTEQVGEEFKQNYDKEETRELAHFVLINLGVKKLCGVYEPPTPGGGGGETNKPCNNTGQFGGTGVPLKDIKLFLYANNVTKGTIKLSKPQVEVGTFATDWRPNPSDYVKANSDAYKKIKSLAVQQGQSDAKKYMQIESTDGTLYGVDLWGGDVKKLLEQQQAEIEELKKLVQTLETKINV